MKYSSVLVFATMASALPSPAPLDFEVSAPIVERRSSAAGLEERVVIEDRQSSSSGLDATLKAVYNSLAPVLTNDTSAILNAIATARGSVAADLLVKIQGDLQVDYNAIINALTAATAQIVNATTGAAGGAVGAIQGFTAAQLNEVISDANKLIALINNLRAVIVVTAQTQLAAGIQTTLNQEIAALQAAIKPFVTPLTALAAAAAQTSASAFVSVTGLSQLINGIVSIVTSLLKGLQ